MALPANGTTSGNAAPGAVAGSRPLGSPVVALFLCTSVVLAFLTFSPADLDHWFLAPVWLCGVVIGTDLVDWLRGRLDVFDPAGILGAVGVHFFFLAPLLHVHWDKWLLDVAQPPDWRDWLGGMAILNFAGLLVYRAVRRRSERVRQRSRVAWRLDTTRFAVVLLPALVLCAAIQMRIYAAYGGILGYIGAYERGYAAMGAGFRGMGVVFAVSESLPILAVMGFAVWARNRKLARTWLVIFLVLAGFLVLQLLFGGLRGSRSNVVWALFWAVVVIHFWVRRISRRLVVVGAVFLVAFMYVYSFYKHGGLDGLRAVQSEEARAAYSETRTRSLEGVLIGDLARSDVQAYVLYRLVSGTARYEYSLGRTYLGTLALLVPARIWPDRPPTKVKEGTEVQYGAGMYYKGVVQSSRVYGLAGEVMLNFGPGLVPLGFALLGFIVGRVRSARARWDVSDSRVVLLPVLINFCFVLLTADSDNLLFFIFKNGLVPFTVIFLSSRFILRGRAVQGGAAA